MSKKLFALLRIAIDIGSILCRHALDVFVHFVIQVLISFGGNLWRISWPTRRHGSFICG